MSGARKTDDTFTHVRPLPNGDELRIRADHGRIYLEGRQTGSRFPITFPIPADMAVEFFRRGGELAALAPSTGRQRA